MSEGVGGEAGPGAGGAPTAAAGAADPSARPDPARRFRWQALMVGSAYLGYAALMHAKQAPVLASPEMLKDPGLSFDASDYGSMIAWGAYGGVAGKLVNGMVADRLGGRRTFLLVVAVTALVVLGFLRATSAAAFTALYFLAMFAKAACWPSFANLISRWFVPRRHGSVWGILSTSARVGTLVAGLLLGSLLESQRWPFLFQVVAGMLLVALVLCVVFLKERPRDVGLLPAAELAALQAEAGEGGDPALDEDPDTPDEDAPHALDGTTVPEALRAFFASKRVWLICLSIGCITVLVEFTNFHPLYMTGVLGLGADDAARATSAFPAGMFLATLVGGFTYDRLSPAGKRNALGGTLLVAFACALALLALPRVGLGEAGRFYAVVAVLGVFGAAVAPGYYLPMSVFSIRFGGPHCGVLIGLIDAFGYFATGLFSSAAGRILEDFGWDPLLGVLAATAAGGAALMVWFTHNEIPYEVELAEAGEPTHA